MDDRRIVEGVLAGDRDAIAALYDRYADALHDYARRRTAAAADAADIVHDAFLVAVERMGQLRDPDRLRPWLYAIARTELHRRYRHAARFAELEAGAPEPVSAEPGPDVQVQRRELVALLREATAGLTDSDRELLDLHLRHGLSGADLAAAAGMPVKHASVALERVTSRLARTLGVVLLARRPTCREFVSITKSQPGLTPLARKRLARHVDNCEVCHLEQSRRMRPEVLLAAVPAIPVPTDLRHRVVAEATRPTQAGPDAGPDAAAQGGPGWDRDGFPTSGSTSRSAASRSDRRPLWWVAVAAAALVLILGAALVIRQRTVDDPRLAADPPARTRTSQPAGAPTVAGRTTDRPQPPPSATAPPSTAPPPSTATSTTTADTEPPTIADVGLAPRQFATTFNRSSACGTATAATTSVVSATVEDPSDVESVSLVWSHAGDGGYGPFPMTAAGAGYQVTIGPVPHGTLPNGDSSYPISVTITAVDTEGNRADRTFADVGTLRQCAIIF